MGELAEDAGKFLWGLAQGVVKGVIIQDVEDHYEEDVHQHPAESFGQHVGHAIGATVHDIFNLVSSN